MKEDSEETRREGFNVGKDATRWAALGCSGKLKKKARTGRCGLGKKL